MSPVKARRRTTTKKGNPESGPLFSLVSRQSLIVFLLHCFAKSIES